MAGEIDIATAFPIDQVAVVKRQPNLKIISQDGVRRTRLVLNANKPPFDNMKVRQAVNAAINRDSIIKNLLFGYATPLPTLTVPVEVGYNDKLDPHESTTLNAPEN